MLRAMRPMHHSTARIFRRIARLGLLGGLRSIEINPDSFRLYLAGNYGLRVRGFDEMLSVPVERLDSIAAALIRETQRLAMLEGAGFGLGGGITLLPDMGVLTVLTLRLIQRLCLLYGFEARGSEERIQLWLTAAAAAGVDYSKGIAEKQVAEKVVPRIVARLAVKLGEETAEKWVGRLVPLLSSVTGAALNYGFVRAWSRRVQRHLRERHLAARRAA